MRNLVPETSISDREKLIASHRILWDAITYACLRYLLLIPKYPYVCRSRSACRRYVYKKLWNKNQAAHLRLCHERPTQSVRVVRVCFHRYFDIVSSWWNTKWGWCVGIQQYWWDIVLCLFIMIFLEEQLFVLSFESYIKSVYKSNNTISYHWHRTIEF